MNRTDQSDVWRSIRAVLCSYLFVSVEVVLWRAVVWISMPAETRIPRADVSQRAGFSTARSPEGDRIDQRL